MSESIENGNSARAAALRLGVPEKARFTRVRTPAYTKNFHDVKTLV